jgi:uncharacterized protein YlzI (FlbEa/FlbD family)
MSNGNEYVVTDTAAEIVELIIAHRARVLATASRLAGEV